MVRPQGSEAELAHTTKMSNAARFVQFIQRAAAQKAGLGLGLGLGLEKAVPPL